MISWTESTSLTALTSSQTASGSNSFTRPRVTSPNFSEEISRSAISAETTSADAQGATYITKTGSGVADTAFATAENVVASYQSGSYSSAETRLPNGARTTTSQSTSAFSATLADTDNSFTNGGNQTQTTLTNSSTATTRSSQTTTQASSNFNGTTTTTTIASTTRGTTTAGTPSSVTIPTVQFATRQATTSTATQFTRNVTRTTSVSSDYTSWFQASGVYAGLGSKTNILPESGEVIWAIKSSRSADTTGALSALADSYISSFDLTAASRITAKPASPYNADTQDSATLFFSTDITFDGITATSTVSDQPFTTLTLYSFSSGGGFPLVSYAQGQTSRTQSTATIEVFSDSSDFVFGSSTTMATVGVSTMTAKHGGLVHQLSFATTSTASRWTDGLALSSYSTTFVGDGDAYETDESITEENSQGATIQGSGLSYGLIAVGSETARPMRDIESSYRSGWASPADITNAVAKIGLEPDIYAFAPNAILGRAFPRVISPFPATTVSLGISTRGSSTWSYGPLGVSRTSISTETTATAETTSASWTKEGSAITEQGDFFGFLTPTTSFISANNVVRRFGGKPAVGSNITAVIAPGKYLTAAGSSSATVRYNTPQAIAGTVQTAFVAQPDYVVAPINPNAAQPVGQPGQTLSYVRNPLPYSSTFFAI